MTLVIDASITASWLLPDEQSAGGQAWFTKTLRQGAAVPAIWQYEVRNILRICEKRGRLGPVGIVKALETLASLPIVTASMEGWDHIMWLSARHTLTIYDASYLELALRVDGQLATFDRALAAAAQANGVLACV
ncbi:Predicted nucleic acid-binding protein, contains PIN domain [Rhizobium sp. RU35A]|uniref:type II toxin-antitoxin system VapC family toxin n=1 Tax=Rhizobium sp. RU35A TaxID=1907414 RepID=UPI0009572CD9|nr:type II toxin-antitoxin system VapC family toxin [Rhizobium sp. RU35A]SIP90087.1 Predicted nucleic acid-binding protein, contains PIN domain [Rhizobium sp. RU35A]